MWKLKPNHPKVEYTREPNKETFYWRKYELGYIMS